MQTEKLVILVDDREARAEVLERLRAHADLDVRLRRLRIGDYAIPGRIQFERKTVSDFAQSLVDGRLFVQAMRLRASRLPGVLIVEGPARQPGTLGISRPALQGALVALSVVFGIPLLRAANPTETADLIRFAAHQIARPSRGVPARPGYRPKGMRRRQLFLLQGLPGIGPQRAQSLLETFGSVARVCQADADELAKVGGIGPVTAARIVEVVRSE